MRPEALLDLVELVPDPDRLVDALRRPLTRVDELMREVCPAADHTSRRTVASLLVTLGVATDDGWFLPSDAAALGSEIELTLGIRAELAARQPLPPSQLVITATTSPELTALRRSLGLRPLAHLVEDVVRVSSERCVLGAPYWNSAALEQLRSALYGFARRRGSVEFVCQRASLDDQFNPLGVLRRFCTDFRFEGGTASVWAFDARDDEGHHALIHAKFALADTRFGYLGSANMTGQGFAEHFEIGVRLGQVEVADLSDVLQRLRDGGFLVREA